MLKRILFILLASWLLFSISMAMPPYPDLLQKIKNGQIPEPIFMSDPSYNARMGIDQGRAEPLIRPGTRLTNFKFLAVMVGFSDQPGSFPPVFADSVVFGLTNLGIQGPPLRQFYLKASYGTLNIVTMNYPSSTGWTTSPHSRAYYTSQGGSHSYGAGTYPHNSQALCEYVVAALDPIINYANYDNDGDGYVDGIIIIHSGKAAEVTGDTLDIWSHSWGVTPQMRDGVYISNYCVVPEAFGAVGDFTTGVYCHEFGHVLGLPDLYDYGYDSYGLGGWSLMAAGSWNGRNPSGWGGYSPSFLDAWSRVFLGFVTPINITSNIPVAHFPSVEDSAVVYRLWTNGTIGPEYFLAEFRGKSYTDTALAGWGIAIYHVDDAQTTNDNQWWPGMPPANHYHVAIEQADNLYHLEHMVDLMDSEDLYPDFGYNNAFNNASAPSSADYYGNPTQVSIDNIAEPDQLYGTTAHLNVMLSGGGCHYVAGDANGSNSFTGLDITYSVRFFKGGPAPTYTCECPGGSGNFWYVAGDVNGSCSFTGLDITYMVRYFKGGPGPIPCPSCPPAR
jgi:immune inhibitor A